MKIDISELDATIIAMFKATEADVADVLAVLNAGTGVAGEDIKHSCAMNNFVDGIDNIHMTGNVITGISKGVPFILKGCSTFNWGKIRAYVRKSGRNEAILTNGPYNSRVAIESIYAILKDYIEDGKKDDYYCLVGNAMANQNAMGLPINPEWVELVTLAENSAHGRIWNYCHNAGVMTVFSANDDRFMAHIRNFQGRITEDLTKDWVLKYPGHWESWGGHDYYVIAPVKRFIVVKNEDAETVNVIGVTTDDMVAAYEGCIGQQETLVGEFDTYREVNDSMLTVERDRSRTFSLHRNGLSKLKKHFYLLLVMDTVRRKPRLVVRSSTRN